MPRLFSAPDMSFLISAEQTKNADAKRFTKHFSFVQMQGFYGKSVKNPALEYKGSLTFMFSKTSKNAAIGINSGIYAYGAAKSHANKSLKRFIQQTLIIV
ncbi:hypothetical protein SDC9_182989 [bioreactor metagenome]|uniref:Uncharacterized protein n=1 Tax=bioreactor metagenome TaxID=1076179 RepID=A0A645H8Y1_9ZZZZ